MKNYTNARYWHHGKYSYVALRAARHAVRSEPPPGPQQSARATTTTTTARRRCRCPRITWRATLPRASISASPQCSGERAARRMPAAARSSLRSLPGWAVNFAQAHSNLPPDDQTPAHAMHQAAIYHRSACLDHTSFSFVPGARNARGKATAVARRYSPRLVPAPPSPTREIAF